MYPGWPSGPDIGHERLVNDRHLGALLSCLDEAESQAGSLLIIERPELSNRIRSYLVTSVSSTGIADRDRPIITLANTAGRRAPDQAPNLPVVQDDLPTMDHRTDLPTRFTCPTHDENPTSHTVAPTRWVPPVKLMRDAWRWANT